MPMQKLLDAVTAHDGMVVAATSTYSQQGVDIYYAYVRQDEETVYEMGEDGWEYLKGVEDVWRLSLCQGGLPPYDSHTFTTLEQLTEYLQEGKVWFISPVTEWEAINE